METEQDCVGVMGYCAMDGGGYLGSSPYVIVFLSLSVSDQHHASSGEHELIPVGFIFSMHSYDFRSLLCDSVYGHGYETQIF